MLGSFIEKVACYWLFKKRLRLLSINTYFEEPPTWIKKDSSWSICQLLCSYTRCSNESNLPTPFFFTWSVLTNQFSNLLRSNYKFSLHLRVEAPNKKIAYKKEIVLVVRYVKRWSGLSKKSVSFDLGITSRYVSYITTVISAWCYVSSKCSEMYLYIKNEL